MLSPITASADEKKKTADADGKSFGVVSRDQRGEEVDENEDKTRRERDEANR